MANSDAPTQPAQKPAPTPQPMPAAAQSASSVESKPLDPGMTQVLQEQLEYLREHNSGIQSMNYFYEIYKELYGNRTKELLNAKKQGKKIVGVFCNFVPLELIIAADAIPLRLCSGFQEPILPAEEVLPRNFCPLIKSSYGFSMMDSPHFDIADVLIIPTTCDGKKKLAEILADRKQTWVIEVPHTQETPQARQLWLTEIKLLKSQLEKLTGKKITSKKLRAAIELVNRKRAAARRLYELRKGTPPPIWGRDAMLVTNLGLYDDTARWTERVEALCDEIENRQGVCDISIPRIMLTGSPTVFPTWKIPVLTEESEGIIVMDDVCTGSKELWDPIETAHWNMTDMQIAIADKYLMNTCACFTPNMVRLNRVLQFTDEFHIDGVIYHVLQACHIYGMEQLRIEKALDKKNIPVLNIETDFSQEDVEQIRTRVEAFLEMVSIRKKAKRVPAPAQPAAPATPPTPTAPIIADVTAAPPTQPAPSQVPAVASSATTAQVSTAPIANDPTVTAAPVAPSPPAATATTPLASDPTHTAPAAPATTSTPPPASAPPAAPPVTSQANNAASAAPPAAPTPTATTEPAQTTPATTTTEKKPENSQ
jgi:benzoyl-CoA reductase/2-hydroxyglutaryl-CoA dehydratase subunit BcrC/BadD/HgdB